jgi:hypothetical protein
MPEYMFLMHDDRTSQENVAAWERYIAKLQAEGRFRGGSALGGGAAFRKAGSAAALSRVTGFIRIAAASMASAESLLVGNPVYEAGGTVEIRELDEG